MSTAPPQCSGSVLIEREVIRNQPISIYEQLELGRHWGRLHKHATGPVPQELGLEEVHRKSLLLPIGGEITDRRMISSLS